MLPYRIIAKKRGGGKLSEEEIRSFVDGVTDGHWSQAQIGAFLMAMVLRGLDQAETETLTEAMTQSGECWELARERPLTCDKHSTGGVGDKVSLVFAPLVASFGLPVAKLTGRGLGHTGGTADKLESIPGFTLDFDRDGCLRLLDDVGMAIGIATRAVAPADKLLYAIRNETATVDSLPLITASILSKKLAVGAGALVFDVKTGSGAFLPDPVEAEKLARLMVTTANDLGCRTSAWLTDMSQPLGEWVGNAAEVREALAALEGEGPEDLLTLAIALAKEALSLQGREMGEEELMAKLRSGEARETFLRWTVAQGADPAWARNPELSLAPEELTVKSDRAGSLVAIDTRQLGMLLVEAGGGRSRPGDTIDAGISMWCPSRIGDELGSGDELARLYLRTRDEGMISRVRGCFSIGDPPAEGPPLLRMRIAPES